MIPSFSDGLSLAMLAYGLPSRAIQIDQVQQNLADLMLVQRDFASDMDTMKQYIGKTSKFQMNGIRYEANRFLESLNSFRANEVNIDALTNLLCSLGSNLLAITVSGKSASVIKGTVFGRKIPSVKSTLITTGMDTGSIFASLRKVSSMLTITKAVVVTRRLDSEEDIRSTSVSIVSFLKVLHVLGHDRTVLCDSDRKQANTVHIKFEGTFSLREYMSVNEKRKNVGFHYLQTNKKNVYILGPNGSGKSTWGNLFIQQNEFTVGDSIHTTLIPESMDVALDTRGEIRVWDTPGLFDGSYEQAHMECHMDKVINQQMFYLSIVFVFNGSHQSNKMTLDILDHALRKFGERVKTSFVAIVNDKDGNAVNTSESYWEHLQSMGFKLRDDTFFVASAFEEGDRVTYAIKEKFATLKPSYVAKHREYFDNLSRKNGGNFAKVLTDMNQRSHEELHNFIDNGKVRVAINDAEGFFDGCPPATKIRLRQYETRYFFRKMGYGSKTPVDEKVILLDESLARSDRTSINLLNRTAQMEQRRIFLNCILRNPTNILMTSTSDDCDFILFDYAKMNAATKRETMEMHILKNKNFGLDDIDISEALSDLSSTLSRTVSVEL